MTRIGAGLWGQFQFTPLREGRRNVNLQRAAILISIHAPPRGATLCLSENTTMDNFNSRPSARGDEGTDREYIAQIMISIHAPPRGATGRLTRRW